MSTIHGFELIKEREIHELSIHARLFRHEKTGAELLSLENEDENKVFGITFRTPPDDSTGVPHIMEHSVLNGSEKYPVKEPFVELVKGSLKTFLNAFTYPDKTCYPVASQNLQDFYNLIDVYMDSVLHPLIDPMTLQQEGWHYELEDLDDELKYKGVVFNEMKGAYSSPDNLLQRYSQQSLYPDTTYGVDSGGDPRVIPDLTYEQFKEFHEKYYHPSNARIFFYGDDDPEERLRRMNEYLKDFEPIDVDSKIKLQPMFDEPKWKTFPYDTGPEAEGKKGMVTVNWLLPETTNLETNLGLHILTYILVGTPGSPLRKALIDSGLGEDLAGVGIEGDLRQMYFSTGLKGIAVDDAEKVQELILDTLTDLAQVGIEADMVEAAINTTEFRLRENNTGSFPRGLLLMLRSLTTWLYDADPVEPLAFERPLESIKKRISDGEPYFEKLLKQYWLANPHRTTVVLEPDPDLGRRQEQAEKDRLARVQAEMSREELKAIVENTKELKRRQMTPDDPEDLAKIPTLTLDDLEKKVKIIPLEVIEEDGRKILYHDLVTNDIVYLDLGFNLHALPQQYLPYLSLFGRAFVEMGTEREDFVKLSRRIGRTTGGIRPTIFTSALFGAEGSAAWLFLRGKATMEYTQELLSILKDILKTVKLDNRERFRQMVLEEKADQESSLVPMGHRVVSTRLRSLFNEGDWAQEQIGGIDYLFFLRRLAEDVDKDWPSVQKRLEEIRLILVNRMNMIANVTLDSPNWEKFRPELEGFLDELPSAAAETVDWRPEYGPKFEGLVIPAQVNYVGKGGNLYEAGYELDGSIYPILNYLRTTWLWERIRVQGGAYGGFCVFDHRSGVFTFLSYRDPNLLETLENYDGSAQFLRQLDLSHEELTKSVIGAIGDMDQYQLPDMKGYTSMIRYLTGDSDERRQKIRDQMLAASAEDFRSFGEVLERLKEDTPVVVMGSQDKISAANADQPWLEVKKVL